jgi:preprotein translocase subunit SecE
MKVTMARIDPATYVRQVRQEVSKVTWPTRKETLITTGLVLVLSALAATFLFVVDWMISLGVRAIFGFGA